MQGKSWLIGAVPLASLLAADPALARQFFGTPASFTLGVPPGNLPATQVAGYTSYAAYVGAATKLKWVLYDPEEWPDTPAGAPNPTPLMEQQHPTALMTTFAQLARSRGQRAILAPARNLVLVAGADCTKQQGEPLPAAYLRCQIPAAGATGSVFACQSQADQGDPAAFQAFVQGAAAQLPAGFPVWAGLTTMRGDSTAAMTACYQSVLPLVQGFWLNTSPGTIGAAVDFLKAIQ